jgi:hypothetical protein
MELVGSLGQAQRMHGHLEINVSNPTQAQSVALGSQHILRAPQ